MIDFSYSGHFRQNIWRSGQGTEQNWIYRQIQCQYSTKCVCIEEQEENAKEIRRRRGIREEEGDKREERRTAGREQ